MFRKSIKLSVALPIVLAVGATFFMIDNSLATASVAPKKQDVGEDYCLKCHVDMKTVKGMQDKRADPTYCAARAAAYRKSGKRPEQSYSPK